MVVVQLRNDTEGRRYYRRKFAAGKTAMEAMRALNPGYPTSSPGRWPLTPNGSGRAREDKRGRLCNPARPT